MRDGFIKVAAGTPKLRVADCRHNAEQIFALMREADRQGVRVLVLPELCLTGATCGDLFFQDTLLRGAEEGLCTILEATKNLDLVTALGLPVRSGGRLYDCAAVIHRGALLGLVARGQLRGGELGLDRWFSPGPAGDGLNLCGEFFPTGHILLHCQTMPQLTLGVVLGDDLALAEPGAALLAREGATVILNLTATAEAVGRTPRRLQLAAAQSARLHCGYLLANAGEGESTTDLVFGGHCLVAEDGALLEQRRFATGLTISEIDVARLGHQRLRDPSFPAPRPRHVRVEGLDGLTKEVWFPLEPATTTLTRHISPSPFVPEDPQLCKERCEEILYTAALGLKKRLEHTGAKTAVVGLSGGLDSTLAVLITALAMKLLERPAEDILAVTMPCFGTTERTRDNAMELAQRLGATLRRIDIGAAVKQHFKDIGQSMHTLDVTFENAQARERTQVLMDIANQEGGLVIGTGDLSELALGWATYNGDHMSMYAVNASIPKTLMRHLVTSISHDKGDEDPRLSAVLTDILATPISPELLPAVDGTIAQRTEELVGPYELHDFFLYYAVRWACPPRKILRLAQQALGARYDRATLLKWLKNFYRRFFSQQFKRSCLPDGPMVGSVTLSPRGGLVMPSDAVATLWLEELEEL